MNPTKSSGQVPTSDALYLGRTENAIAIFKWYYDRGIFIKQVICKEKNDIVLTESFAGPQRMHTVLADLRTMAG